MKRNSLKFYCVFLLFIFIFAGLTAVEPGAFYIDDAGNKYGILQENLFSFQKPFLNSVDSDNGKEFSLIFNKAGWIHCFIYPRDTKSVEPEQLDFELKKQENGLYTTGNFSCPENGILYAYWTEDLEQLSYKSPALIYDFKYHGAYDRDLSVISPLPGKWDNLQTLVIDTNGSNSVVYTLDGSNPFENGIAYNGPVLLEKEGNFILRVADVSKNIETSILFSQANNDAGLALTENEEILGSYISSSNGFSVTVPGNSCYGLNIHPGFSPVLPTETTENPHRLRIEKNNTYSSLIINSDGKSFLYTLYSGNDERETKDYCLFSDEEFHFLFFNKEVFVRKKNTWVLQAEPVLFNRSVPHEVLWREKNTGNDLTKINQLFLSGKPEGFDFENYLKSKNKNIQNLEIRFSLGINSIPEVADKNSNKLDSFEFNLPDGTEGRIFLSLSKFDGDYISAQKIFSFDIDKKSPFIPFFEMLQDENMILQWTSLDKGIDDGKSQNTVYTSLETCYYGEDFKSGDLEFRQQNEIVFSGDLLLYPLKYKTAAYSIDSNNRKSLSVFKDGVIYPNGIYISSSGNIDGTGTFDNPVSSIDRAFTLLTDEQKDNGAVFFVTGEQISCNKHIIDFPLEIRGLRVNSSILAKDYGVIRFKDNGFFDIVNGKLSLKNISLISAQEKFGVYPLVNSDGGTFNAEDSLFMFQGDSQMFTSNSGVFSVKNSIIKHSSENMVLSWVFNDSEIDFAGVELNYEGNDFIQVLESNNSKLKFDSCTFNLNSQTGAINGLLIKNSKLNLTSSVFNTKTDSACRILETWNSVLDVSKSSFYLKNNNDVFSKIKVPAIWLDSDSRFGVNFENKFQGFSTLFSK